MGEQCRVGRVGRVPPALGTAEKYHAFIAHSSHDAGEVSNEIKESLEDNGFVCCHADRDFHAGKGVVPNICENISSSRRVIAVVSPHFLDSGWTNFEMMITVYKENASGKCVMIPVLYNVDDSAVPHVLKGTTYLKYGEVNFWPRLMQSICDEATLSDRIPAGNVAHGLAWSYFYGFLNLVLPGMRERLENHDRLPAGRVMTKMVIVLPESCYCPGSLTSIDDHITFHTHVPYKATRAGNIDRDYKSSVYKITDGDDEFYSVVELATPLLSLYEMEQGAIAGLTIEDKLLQMNVFEKKLREILEHSNNRQCNNTTVMLVHKDLHEASELALGEHIAKCIRAEFAKEKRLEQMRKMMLDEAIS